jgi:hypothetical protein
MIHLLAQILTQGTALVNGSYLEIAHQSIQRVYLLQNWVEAQSYWAVLSAKSANAIGLPPEKRDTGNRQKL